MLDAAQLITAMKRAALEAVEASKPVNIYFGEVVSAAPLKINVEQKMLLGDKQLILTRQVTDYSMDVEVDWLTQSSDSHAHKVNGRKRITVYNGLKKGEHVIIARQQRGQKFIVIDRVGDSV